MSVRYDSKEPDQKNILVVKGKFPTFKQYQILSSQNSVNESPEVIPSQKAQCAAQQVQGHLPVLFVAVSV